jgi:hypothetical protein
MAKAREEGRKMLAGVCAALIFALVLAEAAAQEREKEKRREAAGVSCRELAPPKKKVQEKEVGIEDCRIVSEEIVFNARGERFIRQEIRISGTVEGWAAKAGPRFNYFNDAPDFVYTQSGNTSRRFKGIGRYEGATGSGMSLFVPESPGHWNGKLFVTAHGAGAYGDVGDLLPRDPNADFNPLTNINRYVGLMIDKGYAVAHTLRSSQRAGGDITVTLEDGTTLPKYNVSSHAGFIRDFTALAANAVQKKLGRRPQRTYFYGFSAGGFLGRLLQYGPGFNVVADGRPLFDGFLLDDAGGGLWLPVLTVDGKDVLFAREEDRRRFVPQIDVTHQLYAGESNDYLQKKRENALILKRKGLAHKHRMYEIRGVSHFDAGQVSRPDLVHQTLDLGGVIDSLIDRLDRWVEAGEEPPPTKSDLPELGGKARDGRVQHPAVALPEIACPLGVHYIFPAAHGASRRGGQETAFARFDGVNLEPLDGRGEFVDMNGNRRRDRRETVSEAWARLGLLERGERITQAKYLACVAHAAANLARERLIPERLVNHYIKQALSTRISE